MWTNADVNITPSENGPYLVSGAVCLTDVVGRNFKQPKEGLGLDVSPSAHMWRTIMWPTRYL